MSCKDDFKNGFDRVYEIMKRKYPDIRFPCYGGRFYWFIFTRHFESLYFYLTQDALIYTASSAYITKIPFEKIKKLSIRQGILFKRSFDIRIIADKKYHFIVNDIKDFSTKLTGIGSKNVNCFIDILRSNVEKKQ